MINTILKIVFSLPVVIVLLLIIVINFRLTTGLSTNSADNDLLLELHGLKNYLNAGADKEMQKIYPEGYVFFNAFYGLAWFNYIQNLDRNSTFFIEGHKEIQRSFNNINSETGRSPFDDDLSLPYGAFYTGWSTYLLAKKN